MSRRSDRKKQRKELLQQKQGGLVTSSRSNYPIGSVKLELVDLRSNQQRPSANFLAKWHITTELAEILKDKGIRVAYILILIAEKKYDAEERVVKTVWHTATVHPLDRGQEFITFKRPGEQEVQAFLIFPAAQCCHEREIEIKSATKEIERYYTKQLDISIDDLRRRSALNHDHPRSHWFRGNDFRGDIIVGPASEPITKVISQECFAKEPRKWVKDLVGKVYETPNRDECHLRGRIFGRIVTFFFLGLWCAFVTILKTIWIVLLFVTGARDLNWRWLTDFTSPLHGNDFSDAYDNDKWDGLSDEGRNFFSHDAEGNKRPHWFGYLNPLVFFFILCGIKLSSWMIMGLIRFMGFNTSEALVDAWRSVYQVILSNSWVVIVGLIAMSLIGRMIVKIASFFFTKPIKSLSEWWENYQAERARKRRDVQIAAMERARLEAEAEEAEYWQIVTSGEAPKTIKAIVYDWFFRVKDKVCKPFADNT